MDNHLGAAWCWLQKINLDNEYQLIHIDRHYDLLDTSIEKIVKELEDVDIRNLSIEELLELKTDYFGIKNQLFRYDNYLPIFLRKYPDIVTNSFFATHKDGDTPDWFTFSEHVIQEVPGNLKYWIKEYTGKTILNINIDYFYTEHACDQDCYQFLSDQYIRNLAQSISEVIDNIEVLTIALSPEYSGGWLNSIKSVKLLVEKLNVEFQLDIISEKN